MYKIFAIRKSEGGKKLQKIHECNVISVVSRQAQLSGSYVRCKAADASTRIQQAACHTYWCFSFKELKVNMDAFANSCKWFDEVSKVFSRKSLVSGVFNSLSNYCPVVSNTGARIDLQLQQLRVSNFLRLYIWSRYK